MAIGFLRLGTYIKYIPYPVTVGFTAGIAVIIFASQLHGPASACAAGPGAGRALPKLAALAAAPSPSTRPPSASRLLAIARHPRPAAPAAALARLPDRRRGRRRRCAGCFGLRVETIGSRFGGIPQHAAGAGAAGRSRSSGRGRAAGRRRHRALGGIESLLSAVVADGMTGRRHRSNCELVAQGVANIASATVRRHLRHRHDRAHRDQRARRRARPGLGHAARALHAAVHAGRGAARRLHPARGARRRARRRRLEHGREGTSSRRSCALARRRAGAAGDVPADGLRRPHEGIAVGVMLGAFLFLHRMARGRRGRRPPSSTRTRPTTPAASAAYDAGESGAMSWSTASPDRSSSAPRHARDGARADRPLPAGRRPGPVRRAARRLERRRVAQSLRRAGAAQRGRVYAAGATRHVRHVLVREGLKPPLVRYAPNVDAARAAARDATAGAEGRGNP